MCDETESEGESTGAQEAKERSSGFNNVSRRKTITSILGIGGLGVLGTSRRAIASPPSQARPWNQDVDAQRHDLSDLGSLGMAANPTEIIDFEGENLSIGSNGILNAQSGSSWKDSDDDGLLETSDSDGIDVKKVKTDQVTVGSGEPVTGVWASSGELVPLLTSEVHDWVTIPSECTSFCPVETDRRRQTMVPFERLSFTNISQLYVSMYGFIAPISADIFPLTISWRLRDRINDVPITGSETTITLTETAEWPVQVIGSRGPYNPDTNTILQMEGKLSERRTEEVATLRNPGIRVWGEVA